MRNRPTGESSSAMSPGTSSLCRRYLTERELTVYCGIAVRTLQGWRIRGLGPPWVKLRGAVRYRLDDFELWASQQPGGGERLQHLGDRAVGIKD